MMVFFSVIHAVLSVPLMHVFDLVRCRLKYNCIFDCYYWIKNNFHIRLSFEM